MRTINRMAAIVTPKAPFFEWSASVFGEEDESQCGPEEFRTAFLLPERTDIDDALEEVFADIFDEMLLSAVNSPDLWPKECSFSMFQEWFDVLLVDLVHDAALEVLIHDEG